MSVRKQMSFRMPLFTIKENVLCVLYFHTQRGSDHSDFLGFRFYLKQANPVENKMVTMMMMMMMMMMMILQI